MSTSSYSYVYNSYRKGKLRVYLIIKLSRLQVSGARAPLGPTVDTPLLCISNAMKLNQSTGMFCIYKYTQDWLTTQCATITNFVIMPFTISTIV